VLKLAKLVPETGHSLPQSGQQVLETGHPVLQLGQPVTLLNNLFCPNFSAPSAKVETAIVPIFSLSCRWGVVGCIP
jgi:hypothetical protein